MADERSETPMTTDSHTIREPPRLLIPIEVLEGESISASLVEFLAPAEVVLLGYHDLPEQTPTEQASMQYEEKARTAIDDIADSFRGAGGKVETRIAFTHDRDQTVDRVAAEESVTGLLLPNPVGEIEEVIVPIRGAIDVDRLADLVATLLEDGSRRVTLWGLAEEGDEFDAEAAVEYTRNTLSERGLPDDQVSTEVSVAESPVWDIIERSSEFDVIVMGEGGPGLLASLFGDPSERIAEGAVAPVIVVRNR
ncbi:hypothetical protein SY89_00920 [Halolamina pelagica]|uniref:UspA domain-containing protein n=2 Tax=Halolamina pelagica TaxID=699431 RepID=A0A0P7H9Q9_9EURY|nr:hypothetical protein SY89_00920 [Halolamina pelagica]